jgi:hypothetical protein
MDNAVLTGGDAYVARFLNMDVFQAYVTAGYINRVIFGIDELAIKQGAFYKVAIECVRAGVFK